MSKIKSNINSANASIETQHSITMNSNPIVIWYDKEKNHEQQNLIIYFQNPELCLKEIEKSSSPIFLILNSKHATDLLSRIHSLPQIDTILVLCSSTVEKQRNQYLSQHYDKIFDIFDNRQDLFETIEQLKMLYQLQSGKDYLRLADSHRNKNEFSRALQYTHRALTIYRKTLNNENHPLIARCLNNLGSIYDTQGDVNRSFQYYEQAIKIYAKLTPQLQKQQINCQKK